MMDPFWKSNSGKLVIGGCGTQVGILFGFASLFVVTALCAICAFSGFISFGLTQILGQSVVAADPIETQTLPSDEVELLRTKVDTLAGRIQSLPVRNVPIVITATPLPPPPPPKPVAIASTSANLRSGPGEIYNKIGRIAVGDSLGVAGRNPDASWWLITTPDGQFAWVSDMVVTTVNIHNDLPVVTIPILLVHPGAGAVASSSAALPPAPPTGSSSTAADVAAFTAPDAAPPVASPAGTPTAVPSQSRQFVQDTLGYKQIIRRLLLPTVSESFSPGGDQIAVTEKITLYTITVDGSTNRVLLADDDTIDLAGGAVWSPDARYLAFIANRLHDCVQCRIVGLVRLSDGVISYLNPPSPEAALDLPRWTQDGQLLVTAFWDTLSNGTVYVYDTSGQGQVASGAYQLSSGHNGQKWYPWQPGQSWQVGQSSRVDSYYSD